MNSSTKWTKTSAKHQYQSLTINKNFLISSETHYVFFKFGFSLIISWSFFKDYLFIYLFIYFREMGMEGGEGEKHWCEGEALMNCLFGHILTWDPTCNPGMCPDQKSNQWLFPLWDDAQPTKPQQWGLLVIFNLQYKSLWFRKADIICIDKNHIAVPIFIHSIPYWILSFF